MRVPSGQYTNDNLLKRKHPCQAGFTLIELLVTIAIITLLSAALLIALTELQTQSKRRRCQQQVKKIDQLIMQRWDELLHKPLAIRFPGLGTSPTQVVIKARKTQILIARRELLRLEMPERITDISDNPFVFPGDYTMPLPPTTRTFRRKANHNIALGNKWSEKNQGAECLYLILSVMQDQDSSALDFFFPGEIGDTDEDGMLEILDGFGQPIGFLRWAPGISSRPGIDSAWGKVGVDDDGNGTRDDATEANFLGSDDYRAFSDIQDVDPFDSPDSTDMGAADYRLDDDIPVNDPFNLFPLIMSAGRDGTFGTYGFGANPGVASFSYKSTADTTGMAPPELALATGGTAFPYDPFVNHAPNANAEGFPYQFGAYVHDGMIDNISNHQIEVNP